MTGIRRVVVAVPVRDEETLLPACLRSIAAATAALADARPDVAVAVAVALDGCTDSSARITREHGVDAVALDAVGVGSARDAAVAHGLRALRSPADAATWLACTDADTVVPTGWLVRQLLWADRGAELVVGTVEPVGVQDPAVLVAWHARHQLVEGHEHAHGANLGVRADHWRSVGGFGHRQVHEDVELVERVRALTPRWVATDTTRVWTSGRSASRVDEGFAGYIRELGLGAV